MAELGAANYAKHINPANDMLSQRKAYELFGAARVKHWEKIGIVHYRRGDKRNSKKCYSRAELICADKSEQIETYINKIEK
jgi:hypothetical protein